VGDVGQRGDVAHLGQRVGGRLGEQQRVFGSHRRAPRATSVWDTKLVSTPNLAKSCSRRMVEPNTDCEHTTWSPP
jgi:hypothetical protein